MYSGLVATYFLYRAAAAAAFTSTYFLYGIQYLYCPIQYSLRPTASTSATIIDEYSKLLLHTVHVLSTAVQVQ